MRRNPYFFLKEVGDEYYLVPFGQAIEACALTIRVNDVAAFLWQELDRYPDETALAGRVAEEYEVSPEDAASLEEDVIGLLQNLRNLGILLEDLPASEENERKQSVGMWTAQVDECVEKLSETGCEEDTFDTAITVSEEAPIHVVKIAGINLLFYGKEEYFSENFMPFCEENCPTERSMGDEEGSAISVYIREGNPPKLADLPRVLQGMTVSVDDGGEFYVMKSSETPMLREGHLWKDGSKAVLYVDPDVDPAPENEQPLTAADCVFHAIRHVFLLRAQKLGMYVIHSASILHNGKAWLFSALSGTGKSTHTNIWHKLYDTPFLNGDLNLLAFEERRPVVKGIPWCGTSGICTTETYPLGGIILLARSKTNFIEEIPTAARILGIQMRFISPKWSAEQAADSLDFAKHIVETAGVARLHCNMEDEAAEVCRAWIDGRDA